MPSAPLTAALALLLGTLACALFLAWELHNAAGVTYSHWGLLGKSAGDDYDEGAYVISAQLLLRGYPLFHAVFSAQPALFLPSLAAVVRIVPDPVVAGHLYEALAGLAALAGVFWIAWSAYRPLAAPLAVALLALSPGFLLYAHAVEAEMPMLGLCTLAVAAAQSYYLTGRRIMVALCGLLLAAGSEMKLLSVVVAVPLVLLLLGGARRHYRGAPHLIGDALTFALALVLPALLLFVLLAPADQLRQVVTFHLTASRVMAWNSGDNVRALGVFLGYDLGLLLAAAAGAGVGLLSARRYLTLVYALWLLTTLLFLWRYHPLVQHQFVPLLPPLAVLGAALAAPGRVLGAAARGSNQRPDGNSRPVQEGPFLAEVQGRGAGQGERHVSVPPWRRRLQLLVSGSVALVYLGVFGLRTLPVDAHLFIHGGMPNRDLLSALLDRATRPGDFVICDDPMVALDAHRLLPPGLEDPSMVRLAAGYLTAAQAVAATERYRVAAVVASRTKYVHNQLVGSVFSYSLPGYIAWVARHYRRVGLPRPIPAAQVYLRR